MINTNHNCAENMKYVLEELPGIKSVNEIKISNGMIERISVENKSLGTLIIRRLKADDSSALFNFYFHGLSEKSRNLFPPYPLFSPPVNSAEELASRIADWEKEDDWIVLNLIMGEQIIGVCLLKRYKTERPVSGLAVREEYQKAGLGTLLQAVINEQARLLNLKILYATVAPDNIASLRVHRKCGFKETGKLVPHYGYKNGIKEVDRHDIEMVVELNHG